MEKTKSVSMSQWASLDKKACCQVLSNIIVYQLKEIIEYTLRLEGIHAFVKIGDYDNIVQDSLKYKDSKLKL